MKHTKEEILNALQIIKDECNASKSCDMCPFAFKNGNDYRCVFETDENPEDWRIKNEEDITWRAFVE